jgi:hypothetical protein
MELIFFLAAMVILFTGSVLTISAALSAVAVDAPEAAKENDVDPEALTELIKAFIYTYHIVAVVCVLIVSGYFFYQIMGAVP